VIKYRIGRREEKQNQMNTCGYCKKDLYDHKKSVVFCDIECAKIWAVDLVAKMDKEEDLISRILSVIQEYNLKEHNSEMA
jgi:hypothetical protein